MAFNRATLELIHKECLDLGQKKSSDYSSVADGIAICGLKGIATRLVDKVLRVMSLTSPGIYQQVKDESIRDTLLDVINYATYGVSLLDGTWDKPHDLAKPNYDTQVKYPSTIALSPTLKEAQFEYNKLMSQLANTKHVTIRKPVKWKPKKK